MEEEQNTNNNTSSEVNGNDKEAVKAAAETAATAYAGPVGGKVVDALGKTKIGNEFLGKSAEELKKLRIKIAISAFLFALPILLIFFALFVAVLFVLGLFNGSDSSGTACIGSPTGEVSVIFDSSLTKNNFVSLVNSYEVPNGKSSETGRTYSWGYETFFKANAENFYDICTQNGIDPRFIFSIGLHESGYGTSNIALKKGNFFGWAAYDSSPYDSAKSFQDMSDGIKTVSEGLAKNYIKEGGSQYEAIKGRGLEPTTVKGIGSSYASDPEWHTGVTSYMQKVFGITTSSSSCNGSFHPLEKYTLKHKGLKMLEQKLDDNSINSINNFIVSEVDKAGYGTGASVATAGQSLIYGVEQLGYYLPYWWGGGHDSSIGLYKDIGKYKVSSKSRGGKYYYHHSYDCSGFVSWSIRNGCKASFGDTTASGFNSNKYGPKIKLSEAKPGDIIVNDGHVILVVKNNGDGSVITAESTGHPGQGQVKFDSITHTNSNVRDMSSWYAKNCDKSR